MKALQFVAAAALLAGANTALAGEFATKDEAMAMVKKAVGFIKEQGADKAYPEISNKAGQFVSHDLYVVVYGLDGKVLAHGANGKLIGKDMIDAQDVEDGLFAVLALHIERRPVRRPIDAREIDVAVLAQVHLHPIAAVG